MLTNYHAQYYAYDLTKVGKKGVVRRIETEFKAQMFKEE